MNTPLEPTRGGHARRDGLAALAAAEALARGDLDAVDALEPATPAEALAQRNLLVQVVSDVVEAGGQHFIDAVRNALVEGGTE